MGCATGTVKLLLFAFNFIFVIGGILMIVAGSLVLAGHHDYEDIAEIAVFKATPILSIIVGSIVFLIAFLGCCGVLRENNCMVTTYAVILGALLLAQIGIAIAAALQEDNFQEQLTNGFKDSMKQYDSDPKVKEAWDGMQINLKCCGAEKYTDWLTVAGKISIPDSCCTQPGPGCANFSIVVPGDRIYTEGCVTKALRNTKYVVIAAAAIAGVEVLGILFSCCLAARFRRRTYNS